MLLLIPAALTVIVEKWITLWSITLPIIASSIVSVGVFFFVRSMVTLSAVIFLVTPVTQVAAVSVLLLDDAGKRRYPRRRVARARERLFIRVGTPSSLDRETGIRGTNLEQEFDKLFRI